MSPSSPLLTVVQVAAQLNCHPLHVRNLLRRGLPHVRLGRAIRVEPQALAEFIRANRVEPPQANR